MSIGFEIVVRAIPFIDLLDTEEETLATQARDVGDAAAAMDATRRRLAQGVDAFVRSLPATVRSDAATVRAAAYALVGLADERILHHPAGGLARWRERLLEHELYGSALAGQEIVERARAAAYTTATEADSTQAALLAPLYLGLLQAGFEGSLRGDVTALASLRASLAEAVDADRPPPAEPIRDAARPTRIGAAPSRLAIFAIAAWLGCGIGLWAMVAGDAFQRADHIATRVAARAPVTDLRTDPFEHSIGPSSLPLAPGPSDVDLVADPPPAPGRTGSTLLSIGDFEDPPPAPGRTP